MTTYEEDAEFLSQESYRHPFSMSELTFTKLENKLFAQRGSQTLNLGDCFIGDEGCQILGDFIRENPNIHNLELRGNNITGSGIRYLTSAIRYLPALKVLSLEWNNLENGVAVLADALMFNSSLQVLDLRNNKIGPEGGSALARLIETNTSLQRLDLRWNELGQIGGQSLLMALRKSHCLQSIELAGNRVPD